MEGEAMDARRIASVCEKVFEIDRLALSESYWYDSLALCLIDAVFSIGVKYASTKNVVKHYCDYYGLNMYNMNRGNAVGEHTITELITNLEAKGIEKSADEVFCNHQRTSTRNGILKAEAVLIIAHILRQDGIDNFRDLRNKGISFEAEQRILAVPGQKSGLALSYFYMLSGDDSLAKPDRHVIRFLTQHLGYAPSIREAQKILTDAVIILKSNHPHITVRILDYAIWEYMSQNLRKTGTKVYNKLVRDRIPEIIEASGSACVTEILSDEDYLRMIDAKLDEELAEYHKDQNIEELADLMEVIYAAAIARGYTLEQLEQVRAEKAVRRGGFAKKILLKEVIEK